MKNLISSLWKEKNEPKFITTTQIGSIIEDMFINAKEFIIIVSPYINMSLRIIEIIQEKKSKNIDIIIIYRDDFDESYLVNKLYKRKNLHAKCYITENAAIIGSMNLYKYSQLNNDEMGIYIEKNSFPNLYENILGEVKRLCKNYMYDQNNISFCNSQKNENIVNDSLCFDKGKKYTYDDIKRKFSFINSQLWGINQTLNGDIVLITNSNSSYTNIEEKGILYFQGQNTGKGDQKLIYGNKLLYDAYINNKINIFLFKNGVYCGLQYICEAPFLKDGKYFFPLRNKE